MRRILWCLFLCVGLVRADEFLDPVDAFKPSVRALNAHTIELRFEIAKGYYLYREKFAFTVAAAGVHLGEPRFAKGKIKNDEFFGVQEVYFDKAIVELPVQRAADATTPLALKVVLQGCAEAGFCYPPQPHTLQVTFPVAVVAAAAPALTESMLAQAQLPGDDESGSMARSLRNSGLLTNLVLFFLAGLGLSLTPCVFPMIPILSGIIVGRGTQVSRARGFGLSVSYVLGMALTYSVAGVAAGLSGTLISSSLQNPWVLGGFALVFVALALSMFGFYNLQMPSALQSRLSSEAGHIKSGGSVGVFFIGALSALIVGPCVAAPLAGALLYIGQTGNAVLGGLALFAMALGMGVPLLLVGLSAGTLLPRAGAWMEQVKKFFGVVLLATAVQLVAPVIPAATQMVAWALLLIVPAIYLRAIDPLPANASGWLRFGKGWGIVMLIVGAALLVGVLAGNRDPLQPLSGTGLARASAATAGKTIAFERVRSLSDLDARVKSSLQPVMLDFYADWCGACIEMEHRTFSDPAVQARLSGFTLLQVDVTANNADDKALLRKFGLFGPPGILFFSSGGDEVRQRVVGFQDAARFLGSMSRL